MCEIPNPTTVAGASGCAVAGAFGCGVAFGMTLESKLLRQPQFSRFADLLLHVPVSGVPAQFIAELWDCRVLVDGDTFNADHL